MQPIATELPVAVLRVALGLKLQLQLEPPSEPLANFDVVDREKARPGPVVGLSVTVRVTRYALCTLISRSPFELTSLPVLPHDREIHAEVVHWQALVAPSEKWYTSSSAFKLQIDK